MNNTGLETLNHVDHAKFALSNSNLSEKSINDKDVIVSSVFKRVVQSHLFWFCSGLTVLSATAAVVLTGLPIVPFAVVGAALGIAMLSPGLTHPFRLLYEGSIIKTISNNNKDPKNYPWWNEIIPGRLTLGAIPLKNRGHHESISQFATFVLTLLEEFELTSLSLFSEPVTKEDWKKKLRRNWDNTLIGEQKIIITPDFKPVALDKVKQGVECVHNEIFSKPGGHVYVHCKAGRGRSATIVVCYLLKYGKEHGHDFKSVQEAIDFVKSKRSVININPKQRQAIVDFYNDLKGIKKP